MDFTGNITKWTKTDGLDSDCIYKDKLGKCALYDQRRLRGIGDVAFSVDIEHLGGICIFSDTFLGDKYCPTSKLEGSSFYFNEDYSYYDDGNQYIIEGDLFENDSSLGMGINLLNYKSHIYFCAKEGVIHESYCRYCKSYTGSSREGDPRRQTGSCRQKTFVLGVIKKNRIYYSKQYMIDEKMAGLFGYSPTVKEKIVIVPISQNLIKTAYRKDIPHWDIFNYSASYCYRCGPDNTRGYHYYCMHCGTRQLCNACVIDLLFVESETGTVASFSCPDCQTKNSIHLGINCRNAVSFVNVSMDKRNEESRETVEVDYYMIADRLSDWVESKLGAVEIDFPQSDALSNLSDKKYSKFYQVKEGLLTGVYLTNTRLKRAWYLNTENIKNHLIFRPAFRYVNDTFLYDLIICYTQEDSFMADKIATMMKDAGYSVFLLMMKYGHRDNLWNLRYSEALFRTKLFLCIVTDNFRKRKNATIELKEALKIQKYRKSKKEGSPPFVVHFFPHPIEIENDLSELLLKSIEINNLGNEETLKKYVMLDHYFPKYKPSSNIPIGSKMKFGRNKRKTVPCIKCKSVKYGSAYYCNQCDLDFCSGCAKSKRTNICPNCGTSIHVERVLENPRWT